VVPSFPTEGKLGQPRSWRLPERLGHPPPKFSAGVGQKFVENFSGYGNPSTVIFKAKRNGDKGIWFDYVLQFSSGVFIKYSIRLDDKGNVAGLSVG
jgi:D-alanyl-D-alanine carboxypeptidase